MKRGIAVLVSVGTLFTVAYFTASKWAIRHETITFNDASRDNRPVQLDIAVRRDKELQADAGMIKLPVAILNHGNTVKFTEYSFLANIFAARGYEVISIQHDLPTDPPMVTKIGEPFVGRLAQIQRDEGNTAAAIEAATKAYRLAWCDGPPFAYHWGLEKAKQHLKELGAPEPEMPPFDESKFEPMPEVEIDPDDEFHVGDSPEAVE